MRRSSRVQERQQDAGSTSQGAPTTEPSASSDPRALWINLAPSGKPTKCAALLNRPHWAARPEQFLQPLEQLSAGSASGHHHSPPQGVTDARPAAEQCVGSIAQPCVRSANHGAEADAADVARQA